MQGNISGHVYERELVHENRGIFILRVAYHSFGFMCMQVAASVEFNLSKPEGGFTNRTQGYVQAPCEQTQSRRHRLRGITPSQIRTPL